MKSSRTGRDDTFPIICTGKYLLVGFINYPQERGGSLMAVKFNEIEIKEEPC